ncbi:sugar ABC transporter ATP-binding protein [Gulosibacter sp. 10]|uniref:sugar ABC transporter ATP-binding protein n=1 Tax=Gulosibacter sp. 10 TaxID=1255570 RepID=UPI00097E858C|nr:sugar ABC transporter ATP-binding protein [Gulosibacter sp. 10]SJM63907.1 Ribose ABC transport system, ATP-binding protein RbsA (TC 3.A.1.2.1) [Gulosibacter sp. 10]
MNEAQQPFRLLIENASKTYGAIKALSDVRFELRAGEVMALLGENGAGKSTIVKIISGLVRPDSGASIAIDGAPADISSNSLSQAAGIAVVQQEYSTVGTMTIAENLVLGQAHAPFWWGKRRLRENAETLLARVGLEDLDPDTAVEELSVAEMQLLEIARVLARDAKIVIFDEPTAALSDAEIARVLDVVKTLAAEGRSVIYVTHRLGEVFEIADRVTVFRNGRSAEPEDIDSLDVDQVIALMIGRQLGHMYPERSAGIGDPVLEVEGLRAPGLRDDVDLTVRRGEIVGLTGQLGSGTQAIMEALAGMQPRLGGEVRLQGRLVDLRNRTRGIEQGIAYCSADRKRNGIFGGISITRNLSSPWLPATARLGVVSTRRESERAHTYAEQFAIDIRRMQSSVGTLSGGNQQKVALGKWLGIEPEVLLVEEPTRGVDVGARAEIYRQLRELSDAGVAIIVSSSDTNEIFGLCDTIATYYKGRQTNLRPWTEWTEPDLVREVMHRKETVGE